MLLNHYEVIPFTNSYISEVKLNNQLINLLFRVITCILEDISFDFISSISMRKKMKCAIEDNAYHSWYTLVVASDDCFSFFLVSVHRY